MVSIIIPTYNEAENIETLLLHLQQNSDANQVEMIVVDGHSTDNTFDLAEAQGAKAVLSPEKGRATQMNYGASLAKGDILYFVHADTFPPPTFVNDISDAINAGFGFGRYRTKFDSSKTILKINAFFTRFDLMVCYGGDQTLFMKKGLFNSIGGFSGSMQIMEDYDIVIRAKQQANYKIIQKDALVSARKYVANSWYKIQRANYTIVQMFKRGASQIEMAQTYKALLNCR